MESPRKKQEILVQGHTKFVRICPKYRNTVDSPIWNVVGKIEIIPLERVIPNGRVYCITNNHALLVDFYNTLITWNLKTNGSS